MIGAGLAMTALGGAFGAYTQYQQGKAQQANHEYNAKLARNQALQLDAEARENAWRARRNNERELARVRARLANQGGASNMGSSLNVMGNVAKELELRVMDDWRAAEVKRASLMAQSAFDRTRAKQAGSIAPLMAAGTLLTTAGSISTSLHNRKMALSRKPLY